MPGLGMAEPAIARGSWRGYGVALPRLNERMHGTVSSGMKRPIIIMFLMLLTHCRAAPPEARSVPDAYTAAPRLTSIAPTPRDRCLLALEQAPATLPGERRQGRVVSAKPLGVRRVVFSISPWSVVLDHEDFVAGLERFLSENGAYRFPEELELLRLLKQRAESEDIITLNRDEWSNRLDYRLADAFDRGTFEIRNDVTSEVVQTLVILGRSYHCGPECAGGGREYYLPDCQPFLEIQDWIS